MSEPIKKHVKECSHCTVDGKGRVWLCPVGLGMQQDERKARL